MRIQRIIMPAALCILALCASCSYIARNDHHEVYARARYGSDKFTVINDYNIHYIENGEGETVLLIPGLFGSYANWNKIIPALSRKYNIIAMDHMGVGDSDKPGDPQVYTVQEQSDLVVRMLDDLRIERVHVIGVSYGGMIALNLAARYPGRIGSIVCIEGAVIMPRHLPYDAMEKGLEFPVLGDIVVGFIRSGLIDTAIAKNIMGPSWDHLTPQEREDVLEVVAYSSRTASRSAWYALTQALKITPDFPEEAKAIRSPVLYLYGERSWFHEMTETNVKFFRESVPAVEILSFQDGIHDLQLQKPAEVASLALDFFNRNRVNGGVAASWGSATRALTLKNSDETHEN